MDGICLIGTQGKQLATKTRHDSLFTGKHFEFAMRSETCVEPTQSGIFYAGKILFFITILIIKHFEWLSLVVVSRKKRVTWLVCDGLPVPGIHIVNNQKHLQLKLTWMAEFMSETHWLSQTDNSSTILKLDVMTNYGAKFVRGWLVHLTEA